MRKFHSDNSGIAAIEFALVLPILVAISLTMYELSFRLQAADELERYTFQVGDYLSRSPELTDNDITEIYDIADKIVPALNFDESTLSFVVASIGYDRDTEEPVLLWSRTRGPREMPFDLQDAAGLAPPGQSIILVECYVTTQSRFNVFGSPEINLKSHSVFKPRITRAVAINGDLTDVGQVIEGYENE